jgi:hypothetical protein
MEKMAERGQSSDVAAAPRSRRCRGWPRRRQWSKPVYLGFGVRVLGSEVELSKVGVRQPRRSWEGQRG